MGLLVEVHNIRNPVEYRELKTPRNSYGTAQRGEAERRIRRANKQFL
jgi:hypothetical protein